MSREIDKEIAEKLFDKEVFEKDGQWFTRGREGFVCYLKRYSEYIVDAWLVVEKMIEQGYKYFLSYHVYPNDKWHHCSFVTDKGDNDCEGNAESAPLAICKAALKAIKEME